MTHINAFVPLNKYEQLDILGEGGFGQVYQVKDKDSGEIYAAKISNTLVNQEYKDDESTFLLFREVNLFAALNHPSILKFIGYSPKNFDDEEYPTLIIEYAPKGTLEDVLQSVSESNIPDLWDDTRKLMNIYGIASGMAYLHSHNILHRDLKPSNILMDENLLPKISDFGLSKTTDFCKNFNIEEIATQKGKGTIAYLSPEVQSGGEYTKEGDVFSFALVFYQIIENKPFIFKNHDFKSLADMAFRAKRPPISPNIPQPYKELISKCWSQDPSNRPTFSEVLNELKKLKFLTEKIDEEAYFSYVEMIDDEAISFDLSKMSIQFDEFIQGRKKTRLRSNAVREPPKFSTDDTRLSAAESDTNEFNAFSSQLANIEIHQIDDDVSSKKSRKRRNNVFIPPTDLAGKKD